jgi:hypothetical protein
MINRYPVVLLLVSTCIVLGFSGAVLTADFEAWAPALTATALLLASMQILLILNAREPDRRIRSLVIIALALKVMSGIARYAVNALLYDGGGDANRYWSNAANLSRSWAEGRWISSGRNFPGTGFIDTLSAVVFSLAGPSYIGGFIIFAWMGFWGLYLCFRAFTIAVPDGDHLRYGVLVLLLPSLLFWPSAIGKDAWMVLCIGAFAYGTARVLTGRSSGVAVVGLGGLGAGLVRPHITLILLIGLAVATLVRADDARKSLLGKTALLCVVLGAGALALTQVERFFNLSSDEGLDTVLDRTATRTSQGGSAFDGASIQNPLTLPYGIVTVLFRPFPYEANSTQALVTSLEGLVLLCLLIAASPVLLSSVRQLSRQPYVCFALTYLLLFAVAFSSFSNFGILTRQRVQVFPFFLVLLALPAVRSSQDPKQENRRTASARSR